MSSTKKNTSKATKSPAPATKEKSAAKPATKKAAPKAVITKPEAAAAAIVAAVARVAAAPIVAEKPAPVPAPVAVKEVATKTVTTVITAKIDVGFGNLLYVRGEGPGLSWDRGLAMSCLGSDTWQAELSESARPYTFKFLVNDLSWSAGEDFKAPSGSQLTFVPTF